MRTPKTTTTAWVMVTKAGTYYYDDDVGHECTPYLSLATVFASRKGALAAKERVANDSGWWLVRGDKPMRIVLEDKK